ncbi:MAG: hypothetical protein ACT4O5_15435 [Gammaproteobacteria bacterium]
MLGDIAVVTVGILLAFALEAWWDGRASTRQEQFHLRALASDFRQNAERLKAMIERQDRVSTSCRRLLAVARGEEDGSPASIRELMSEVFNSARYEPVMGAYEALVNSGGLVLIRDEVLRGALAEFAAQERGDYAERFSDAHYFAFTHEFVGRLRFVEAEKAVPARPDEYAALLADPRFQEFLLLRQAIERDVGRDYRGLLEQAQTVLAHIEPRLR